MTHTPDLGTAVWRKSSYSEGGANDCLEVTDDLPGIVPVRDSKVPDSRPLLFTAGAWSAFVKVVAAR
ncbi:DUF397 domain-containing protein [Streptomyces caniscabiei]|uniref:DUF397 domain-containing protein n=1 Tax=Streptomyces caniscabiei TaxID=2746961 RepID=UPI0007658554|nr:DUF397 domain-containing protein [Streptomyces caniscabiei]